MRKNPKAGLLIAAGILAQVTGFSQARMDPAKEALRQFEAYKPTIERKESAVVDNPKAITGDLNGDGRVDCIVFFVMTPQGGGNAIIDRQAAVYLNTGTAMKVDGAFPELRECYAVDRISGGRIYLSYYECAPPYMTKTGFGTYRWQGKKLVKG